MKIDEKYYKYIIAASVAVGVALFIINQILLKIDILMMVSILIVVIVPFVIQYNKYKLNREIEERFPDFLRDISSNIKAGMTLPQAVIATKKTDYGLLDPFLDKIAVQIDWGIPFNKILDGFAKGRSTVIKRTVSAINESISGGGNITVTLDAIGASVIEVNTIRKERSSATYSQMMTGYIIFFVFLGVLIALQKFLLPSLNISGTAFVETMLSYGIMFKQLILIQGFFSGIIIGKMSEGRLISGVKHSIALMTIGYIAMTVFA